MNITSAPHCQVVATERSDVLALLEQNIQANIDVLDKVKVLPLDWGTPDQAALVVPVDLVLGAEIIYDERLFEPLLSTIRTAMQPADARAFFSYKVAVVRSCCCGMTRFRRWMSELCVND